LLEYVFVDNRFPEWEFWKHFQMEIFGSVLERDEDFEHNHPIQRRIDIPSEIYSNVDIICYAKVSYWGCCDCCCLIFIFCFLLLMNSKTCLCFIPYFG
jgi:hypothetical protein